MTINRMHELLDQLQQWITDVRVELPLRDENDQTEASPTHTQPLVNLGTVLKKLKQTPALVPPQPPAVKTSEQVAKELALERLDAWLADGKRLDPDDLAVWTKHKRLLLPFHQNGYGIEAAQAFEVFVGLAQSQGVGYNSDTRTFYFIPSPETIEEAATHPY